MKIKDMMYLATLNYKKKTQNERLQNALALVGEGMDILKKKQVRSMLMNKADLAIAGPDPL